LAASFIFSSPFATAPANARQIASRARRRVQAERPRFDPSPEERDRLAERFFAAVVEGDLDGLVQVLADDVVVYGDGGGKVPQWSQPIVGADRVARLFAGLGTQMREVGLRAERRWINGQPGAVVLDAAGAMTNVFILDVTGGCVQAVRSVINPDKLRHLGPIADVRALAASRRASGQHHG
jgi:RNA polymerase sigma-70 factor (ECF subfamily)